jgi:hypothetical protein
MASMINEIERIDLERVARAGSIEVVAAAARFAVDVVDA